MKALVAVSAVVMLSLAPSIAIGIPGHALKEGDRLLHGPSTQSVLMPSPGPYNPWMRVRWTSRMVRQTNDAASASFLKDPVGHYGHWNPPGGFCSPFAAIAATNLALARRGIKSPVLQDRIKETADGMHLQVRLHDNSFRDAPTFPETTYVVPVGRLENGMGDSLLAQRHTYASDDPHALLVIDAMRKIAQNPAVAPNGISAGIPGAAVDTFEQLTGLPAKEWRDGTTAYLGAATNSVVFDPTEAMRDEVGKAIDDAMAKINPVVVDTLIDGSTGDPNNPGALDRIARAVKSGLIGPEALQIKSVVEDFYPGHSIVVLDKGQFELTAEQAAFYAKYGMLGNGKTVDAFPKGKAPGSILVEALRVQETGHQGSVGHLFGDDGVSIVPMEAAVTLFGFVHIGQIDPSVGRVGPQVVPAAG